MSTLPVHYEQLDVGTITLSEEGPSFACDPRWPMTLADRCGLKTAG